MFGLLRLLVIFITVWCECLLVWYWYWLVVWWLFPFACLLVLLSLFCCFLLCGFVCCVLLMLLCCLSWFILFEFACVCWFGFCFDLVICGFVVFAIWIMYCYFSCLFNYFFLSVLFVARCAGAWLFNLLALLLGFAFVFVLFWVVAPLYLFCICMLCIVGLLFNTLAVLVVVLIEFCFEGCFLLVRLCCLLVCLCVLLRCFNVVVCVSLLFTLQFWLRFGCLVTWLFVFGVATVMLGCLFWCFTCCVWLCLLLWFFD